MPASRRHLCEPVRLARAVAPLRAPAVGRPRRELTVARVARARFTRAQLCGPRRRADHVDAALDPVIHRERSTAAGSARSPAAASSLAAVRSRLHVLHGRREARPRRELPDATRLPGRRASSPSRVVRSRLPRAPRPRLAPRVPRPRERSSHALPAARVLLECCC